MKRSQISAIVGSIIFVVGSALFLAASIKPLIDDPNWVTVFIFVGMVFYLFGSVLFLVAAVFSSNGEK